MKVKDSGLENVTITPKYIDQCEETLGQYFESVLDDRVTGAKVEIKERAYDNLYNLNVESFYHHDEKEAIWLTPGDIRRVSESVISQLNNKNPDFRIKRYISNPEVLNTVEPWTDKSFIKSDRDPSAIAHIKNSYVSSLKTVDMDYHRRVIDEHIEFRKSLKEALTRRSDSIRRNITLSVNKF